MTREHDVVLYGATGYVGALIADYLARSAPAGTKIALAGRNLPKLERLRAGLPESARDWPLIVADTGDPTAVQAMSASTTVLATTVGPYAKYGVPVVAACARSGTHYADLTGEPLFHRDMIDTYGKEAADTGAKIVHSCGYDSIPSDLGVLVLHEAAAADGAGGLAEVTATCRMRGGVSGGTIDSMRTLVDAVKADPAARKLMADPFTLSPDRAAESTLAQPSDTPRPGRGESGWVAPFVMASYNTRIVRRSNALLDWAYGRDLRYGEVMGMGSGAAAPLAAVGVTAGLAAMAGAMAFGPARPLVGRLLPKPGEGPSAETRDKGWFRHDILATTTSGRRYRAVVAGSGDPGYKATAVMFAESALSLALDDLPPRAGCLTPAVAMGDALVARLRAAGHTYDVTPG
ncbi:MAG TPA: saccharopine dehydrogenase NADP-binding domain-containing protein [Mycobacteriales bacterium]